MKTRPMPASNTALFLAVENDGHTPNTGVPGDLQDLCSLRVDQAIGIEKASLSMVARLNSCVINIYKNAWFAPVFCNFLNTVARAFAFSMELQMNWLTMMVPHANEGTETLLRVAAPSSTVASISSSQAQPTAEVSDSDMDIAIGAQAA